MKNRIPGGLVAALVVATALAVTCTGARATGTALVQQTDGTTKVYKNVYIRIKDGAMALTSADGVGTVIIGKAACEKVGELIKCIPYDATLQQNGGTYRILVTSGTAWFNPTPTSQPLSYTSTQLPSKGVLLSMHTKAGTYVSLTGTVDEVSK